LIIIIIKVDEKAFIYVDFQIKLNWKRQL